MGILRHGSRLAIFAGCVAAAAAAVPSSLQGVPAVNSRIVDVNFAAQSPSAEVTRVELWYTADGEQWRLYTQTHDPRPPVRFRAASDGLHGFFVILANAYGSSSHPPQPGQSAQQWILIDTTRPLVQMKQVRIVPGEPPGGDTLGVVWSAHDDHLTDRPVSVYYQLLEQPGWQLMASNLTNAGRFDWPLPVGLVGQLEIRLEIVDRAGNRATDVAGPITVIPPPAPDSASTPAAEPVAQALPAAPDSVLAGGVMLDEPPSPEDRRRAHDLYERGVWRRRRGELGLATQRLIEAMNLDPTMPAPAFELGELYYNEGEYEQAAHIYQLILARRPDDREALRGWALALVAIKDYSGALAALERVLIRDPNDARTWLDAGDVFVWMGQTRQARLHWKKARDVAPRASELRRSAELKLRRFRK